MKTKKEPIGKNFTVFKINDAAIERQIKEYNSLNLIQSYRGRALLVGIFLLLLMALATFIPAGDQDYASLIIGYVIYIPILYFTYKGKKWASLAFMWIFSLEKLAIVLLMNHQFNFISFIIYLAIMSFFYKAYLVEKRRKTNP